MNINRSTGSKRPSFINKNFTNGIIRTILLILLIFYLYPFIFVLQTSLKSTSDFMQNIWSLPKVPVWGNYLNAWTEGKIGEYFLNSVIVTAVSIASILLISTLAGYSLARLKVPGSELIATVFMLLLILPKAAFVMPLFILLMKINVVNIKYVAMILAYVGWGIPFSTIVLKNFFQSLSSEILEAAKVEGCTEAQTMFKIAVPLMTPAIATCSVFQFSSIWGELMWAQLVTSTVDYGITLPVGIVAFKGEYSTDWGSLTAGISIIVMPLIITFIFLQKYFVKGLTSSSVKG